MPTLARRAGVVRQLATCRRDVARAHSSPAARSFADCALTLRGLKERRLRRELPPTRTSAFCIVTLSRDFEVPTPGDIMRPVYAAC